MTIKKTFAAALLLGSCLVLPSARAAVTPSLFEMKVYKFAVSTSEDCSNPIVVYSNDNPEYADFGKGPTVGTGALADGTYRCVAFEVSDHIRFAPATSEGACEAGKSYTIDVCRKHVGGGGGPGDGPGGPGDGGPGGGGPGGGGPGDGSGGGGGGSEELVRRLDGTTFSCVEGDVDERVVIYMSTASSPVKHGNAFTPPVDASDSTRGIALSAALVVNGAAVGTFTVDARGKVGSGEENGVAECGMEPPSFGFE